MKYSDSLYLSRFAIDPDSENIGADVIEDFNLLEAPFLERLDDEIYPDADFETGLE